jgi:competence protein ComEA
MKFIAFAAAAYLCAAAASISARTTPSEPSLVRADHSSVQADQSSTLPPGTGRDLMLKICSDCHPVDKATSELKTKEEWNNTLFEMADNGAHATDDEYAQILEYLDKNFSPIQVNKAAAEELAAKLDVSPEVAAAIVKFRQDNGNISSIDQLKKVPRIDAAKVDARKDRFRF